MKNIVEGNIARVWCWGAGDWWGEVKQGNKKQINIMFITERYS